MSDIKLYCGDCVEILSNIQIGDVDMVVTDPPYGLNFPYPSYDDTRENLIQLISKFMPRLFSITSRILILCGPTQIGLYPQPDWISVITWKTTVTFGKYGYNQWTPILNYGKDIKGFGNVNGITKTDTLRINSGAAIGFQRNKNEKLHICPKPITMMKMIIERFSYPNDIILDPFMGSGTTGVACLQTGRSFIGIEIDPNYYAIAKKRIDELL